jgi:head-tail adaptor
MAYSAGMMNKRIKIARRVAAEMGAFGKNSAGQKYQILGTYWGNQTFTKGAKSMHEGALDAYDTVMFRMDYRATIDRWCLIKCHDRWYQIQSIQPFQHRNEMQIIAVEMANQQVTIIENTNN